MNQANGPAGSLSRRSLIAIGASVFSSAFVPKIARGSENLAADPIQSTARPFSWSVASYPEIQAMVERISEVLSFNANEFEGRLGRVYGINAGLLYPFVFARDLGTISEFIGYLFDPVFQRTPVEEFLWTQESFESVEATRGAVAATVSPAGELDKATAVSDEETSVIEIAYQHFRMGGGVDWLGTKIGSKTVLERLNGALDYVLNSRRDGATGLIFRAHTSDWGDVKLEGGEHPTDLLPGDAVTASIFDQALTFRALGQLAEMNSAAGSDEAGSRYSSIQTEIRKSTDVNLWSDALGRYVIHRHLSTLDHPFDESAIVSFGNAMAVHTGLATDAQASSILDKLEAAALLAGTRRAGLSLWPPYPAGTFNHPNMQPFTYQNGGVWDWWAGVQILAEFERGASNMAFGHLVEAARHWKGSGVVPEWFHLPSGTDQGSSDFGGAAGTLGLAVVRGLFGIRTTENAYEITSRLGSLSGSATVQNQHSDVRVAYTQRSGDGWISIDLNAPAADGGTVSVLVPNDWPDAMVLVDDRSEAVGTIGVMHDTLTPRVRVLPGTHTVAALRSDADSPATAWTSEYGRFFPVDGERGYWITDASGIPLWSGYSALGGESTLGPTISGRFILNGLISQAVNAVVLQWSPEMGLIIAAPIFRLLSEAGHDAWLQAIHRIPAAGASDMSILDQDPVIKTNFLNEADWRGMFGMPVGFTDYPDVAILRAENQAFQRWKVATEWGAAPGDVTTVNAGGIAVEAGFIPRAALALSRGKPTGS